LTELQRAIRFGDGNKLFRLFAEARSIRRGIIQAGQDTAAPDFGRGMQTDAPTDAKKGKAETG
jgi:cyclohexadieny/prephenate dehydrogenase